MAEFSDYVWLVEDPAAAALLDGLATDGRPALALLQTLRRQLSAERAALVVEQAELRRRAAAKFGPRAARMFFTPRLLEQATDAQVARYKAARLGGSGELVHDFCCGIGGDLMALVERGPAEGWDRSEIACLLAAANIRAALAEGTQPPGEAAARRSEPYVRVADAATVELGPQETWHADPDRRASGSRATRAELFSPDLETIERWRHVAAAGAVKLAPATVVSDPWKAEAELEWITHHRQCRQQVAWFGRLATAPGRRRATILGGALGRPDAPTGTIIGRPGEPLESASQPGRFVFDPDPSVLAADLLGALAAAHGLHCLGAGGAYLTGDEPRDDPLLQSFRVQECMPLRLSIVQRYLAARKVGRLEVKKRGVPLDPEAVRRRLRLTGNEAATLLLTRIGKREVAIVAERLTVAGVNEDSTTG